MKKMIACLLTLALALTAVCALAEGSLTFSWWGGDARHERPGRDRDDPAY